MKIGKLVNGLIRYKVFHVCYWCLAFVKLYHEKLHFIGSSSMVIPNVMNSIVFQMAGVYAVLYYLRPKFFHRQQYGRFVLFSIIAIGIVAMLNLLGQKLLGFLFDGTPYNGILIVFTANFVDTFIKVVIFVTVVELFRWFHIEQKNKRLEKEKLEHELAFLKAQVNPHFLFNTLNSIYILMDINKEKAAETLLKFSSMLRYQLYDCSEDKIELEKELSLLEDFIALEGMRKGVDINISHSFPLKTGCARIAPFLLIPIVENAFKHVSVDQHGHNFIRVDATVTDRVFRFEALNSCHSRLSLVRGRSDGIGLRNMKRRLELLYPDTHELEITNENDIFTVKLSLYDL